MKQLMAFDLDGTLAESKAPLDDEVAGLLAALLSFAQVAVISGGDWPQFKKQVVDRLPPGAELGRLWILPTAGAKLFRFAGEWRQAYSEAITPAEKAHILEELADFVVDRNLPLGDLITHKFRLAEAEEAFKLFDTATTGKPVFYWD